MPMIAAPPQDEDRRLATLRAYRVLDTAPEEAFERITRLAATISGTPIALISLVDAERQWFKSKIGLDLSETGREISFCAHAILEGDVMVVPDAAEDPRFRDNPLVEGDPGIRFYAGAPLETPTGERIGTLCVIDKRPRGLTDAQRSALRDLSAMAVDALELRAKMLAAIDEEHAKAAFLAVAGHELRSPLNALSGFAGLLKLQPHGPLGDPRYLGYVDDILLGVEMMEGLLGQLIDLSRFETGRDTLSSETVDLRLEAEIVVRLLAPRAGKERVAITTRGESARAMVDRLALRQILMNLVSNAVKYSDPGGRVEVWSCQDEAGPFLMVSDRGVGIAPEDLAHIGEPFRRFHTPGRPREGTGLGLSVVRRLVEATGGAIAFRSRPGQGTTVTVRLPAPSR